MADPEIEINPDIQEEVETQQEPQQQSQQQPQSQPTLDDVFGRLMGSIFKEVSQSSFMKEHTQANESLVSTEESDDECDHEELESPEENNNAVPPSINDFISLFGKTSQEIDNTIKNIGNHVKTMLSDVKKNAEIKKFFLEQLETNNLNDAKKNTFAHFNLNEDTQIDLHITLTVDGIKQTL